MAGLGPGGGLLGVLLGLIVAQLDGVVAKGATPVEVRPAHLIRTSRPSNDPSPRGTRATALNSLGASVKACHHKPSAPRPSQPPFSPPPIALPLPRLSGGDQPSTPSHACAASRVAWG